MRTAQEWIDRLKLYCDNDLNRLVSYTVFEDFNEEWEEEENIIEEDQEDEEDEEYREAAS